MAGDVAYGRRINARESPEALLRAPEAASGEDRAMKVRRVRAANRQPFASGTGPRIHSPWGSHGSMRFPVKT